MKGILLATISVGVFAIAVIMSRIIGDRITIKRGMPDGYRLEVNAKGKFRPCDKRGPLIWLETSGTKASAIRRAWRQAEHNREEDIGWRKYDANENLKREAPASN